MSSAGKESNAKSNGANGKHPSSHKNKWKHRTKHGYVCNDANCQVLYCRRLKDIFKHCLICKKRNNNTCSLCNAFKDFIIYHSKRCQISWCDMPLCKQVKTRIKHVEQETALMQHMAALSLGSSSAPPGALLLERMAAMTLDDSAATPVPSPQQNRCQRTRGGLQENTGLQVNPRPWQVQTAKAYSIDMRILFPLVGIFSLPNIVEEKEQVLQQIKELTREITKRCEKTKRLINNNGTYSVSAKLIFFCKILRILKLVKKHFLRQCETSRRSSGETSASVRSRHEGQHLLKEVIKRLAKHGTNPRTLATTGME